MQLLIEKYSAFMKWSQDKFGKNLHISTWDDKPGRHKTYSTSQQLPKPTEITAWTDIWGTWVNPKPKEESKAFLKIRFTTKSPDTLAKPLRDIGEHQAKIQASTGFEIGRLPIPCQAVQISCVGWLFGSNKSMHGEQLLQEIVEKIPTHIRMGISWRAIKLENGRLPPFNKRNPAASALHIDIDSTYGAVYKPLFANLFKKHGTKKPLGLPLRLIPCFSSDEGKLATPDTRTAAIEMQNKQDYLIKHHIVELKTPFILNLDKPTKPNGTMTLRRYLRSLHPEGLVAARLFISIDKSWQGTTDATVLVTTKEYGAQANQALINMIPECIHRYGDGTQGWFTTNGLDVFRHVEWDPKNNKSVSESDIYAMRHVAEDYFGMGDAWRQLAQTTNQTKRPTLMNDSQKNDGTSPEDITGNPNESVPQQQGKKPATANDLLQALANKKTDAPSFGSVYKRTHDGDTAQTSCRDNEDNESLSSHENEDMDTDEIMFTDLPADSRDVLRSHLT